ncbi:MAG: hypothetical protein CL483_03625 [Acidobacteria bacterium]|nr:hypothetical protein [Acidobacteriota bacterium]|tara:strand:+ start:704 stop:1261 length:558 start_codon:yes stop_codon:yes gene_type:complete
MANRPISISMKRVLSSVVAALTATGCAAHHGTVPAPFPTVGNTVSTSRPTGLLRPVDPYAVSSTARDLRGVPYVDGGTTPAGFDCSGFTRYIFEQHGVELPRLAADQYRVGKPLDPDDIETGDLLFFTTVAPGASHVALSIGGDEFIHAPSERGQVRVERLNSSYWSQRFLGARRVIDSVQVGAP